MQVPGKGENRVAEISEISRSLKALAKELNIPVVAISQLSRAVDSRPYKRPILSDLRDSGAIEQDADVVAFLYRHSVYDKTDLESKGKAEVNIAKQRNGPTGAIEVAFIEDIATLSNILSKNNNLKATLCDFTIKRMSRIQSLQQILDFLVIFHSSDILSAKLKLKILNYFNRTSYLKPKIIENATGLNNRDLISL